MVGSTGVDVNSGKTGPYGKLLLNLEADNYVIKELEKTIITAISIANMENNKNTNKGENSD